MEVSGSASSVDLHFANGIDRVLARRAGQNNFVQVYGLRQVFEGGYAMVLNFDIREFRLDKDLGNMLCTQDLAACCVCRYSRCNIHG